MTSDLRSQNGFRAQKIQKDYETLKSCTQNVVPSDEFIGHVPIRTRYGAKGVALTQGWMMISFFSAIVSIMVKNFTNKTLPA